jgi:DNA polymerase III delta prime subunit
MLTDRINYSQGSSDGPDEITLPDFIDLMKRRHKKNHFLLKNVRDPEKMIRGLEGLNDLIGHEEEKLAAIDMVMYAINYLNTPKEERTQPAQLHGVFYGNPGCGKTAVAKQLSIVVDGLGFLKSPEELGVKDYVKKAKNMSIEDMYNMYMWIVIIVVVLAYFIIFMTYIWSGAKTVYNFAGWWGIGLIFLVLLIMIGLIWWYWPTDEEDCDSSQKDETEEVTESEENEKSDRKKNKDKRADESNLVVIGPEDLISQYLGDTMRKTRDVLHKNRGKVIFIDEAYGLFGTDSGSGYHGYGHDACTVINREMSEHPEDWIIYMAGYEHLLKSTVFKAQPGLESRFFWKFNCADYKPRELFKIFEKQLKDIKWSVASNEHAAVSSNFIKAAEDGLLAKGQARDTERLRNYCQLEYNRMLIRSSKIPKNQITLDLLLRGLKRLKDNSFAKPNPPGVPDTPDTPLSKIFSEIYDRINPSSPNEETKSTASTPSPSSKPTIEEVSDTELESLA